MSLDIFLKNCQAWGLLPNNSAATKQYEKMEAMPPFHTGAAYSALTRKLWMSIPDLSATNTLQQLKDQDTNTRLSIVITCHEIFHNLHHFLDDTSFRLRSRKGVKDWLNEEELLTVTGETGTIALPQSVSIACNPKLFNEHSLCRILRLSQRQTLKEIPTDNSMHEPLRLDDAAPTARSSCHV